MKKNYKEGIDFVFEQNPNLTEIGTKEQYANYLKTIFPESKVKGIFLHGTGHKFEEFKSDSFNYFFTKDKKIADINSKIKGEGFPRIINVLLNSKTPWNYAKEGGGMEVASFHFDKYAKKGYDTMINKNEVAVYEPSQIHLLGSKEDIQGFKNFVSKKQGKYSLEGKLISGFFGLSFIIGIFLIPSNLTGNIIGTSGTSHKSLGLILTLFGILGFFIYNKLR